MSRRTSSRRMAKENVSALSYLQLLQEKGFPVYFLIFPLLSSERQKKKKKQKKKSPTPVNGKENESVKRSIVSKRNILGYPCGRDSQVLVSDPLS